MFSPHNYYNKDNAQELEHKRQRELRHVQVQAQHGSAANAQEHENDNTCH